MTHFVEARQTITFRDCRGHLGRVSYYYDYDNSIAGDVGLVAAATAISTISAAIDALSNAIAVQVGGILSVPLLPNSYGANTDYANCETKARLTYLITNLITGGASTYTLSHIDIPAPLVSIFLADKETVNPANTAVAALTSALTATDGHNGAACTKQGGLYTSFVGGVLMRRKLQRKLTIWSKSPNLDEPEE